MDGKTRTLGWLIMNGINGFHKQIQEASDLKIGRGFHFTKVGDICKSPAASNWIIKPYLTYDSLSVLFGEAGSMKSFFAYDIGLSIVTGREWHGHPVNKTGAVFGIIGEGLPGLAPRFQAWSLYNKKPIEEVPFFISDSPAALMEGPGSIIQAIDELVADNGVPVLIIIDTLNRNFGPGDENSTADMTRFVAACDEIRGKYHCAVLIIHHSGIASADRARGASALRAALDWEYKLQKKIDETRILTCTKAKDHGEPPVLSFKPETITLDGWIDSDGEVMTSCVLRRIEGVEPETKPLRGARRIAYDTLLSFEGKSVHIDDWRDMAYSSGISPSSSSEAKKKAFQRAVTDLLNNGHVDTQKDYYWIKRQRTITGHCRDMSTDLRGTKRDTPL